MIRLKEYIFEIRFFSLVHNAEDPYLVFLPDEAWFSLRLR
jgi:hypothetical protein